MWHHTLFIETRDQWVKKLVCSYVEMEISSYQQSTDLIIYSHCYFTVLVIQHKLNMDVWTHWYTIKGIWCVLHCVLALNVLHKLNFSDKDKDTYTFIYWPKSLPTKKILRHWDSVIESKPLNIDTKRTFHPNCWILCGYKQW